MHKRSNDDNDKQITPVNSESIREYEPTVIDVQVPVHRETTTTAGRTQQPEKEEVRVQHSTPSTNASEATAATESASQTQPRYPVRDHGPPKRLGFGE